MCVYIYIYIYIKTKVRLIEIILLLNDKILVFVLSHQKNSILFKKDFFKQTFDRLQKDVMIN